jgi:hypothetical protein
MACCSEVELLAAMPLVHRAGQGNDIYVATLTRESHRTIPAKSVLIPLFVKT